MIDKTGDEIVIEFDDIDVVALHRGREVGRAVFEEIDCWDGYKGDSFIKWMRIDVHEDYQRRGIATAMVQAAVDAYGEFSRPRLDAVGGNHVPAEDYFTEEGAALAWSCIRRKIMAPDRDEEPESDLWEE